MSLLKDKRIQKLLAQQAEEDAQSSSGEDAPITFASSKFAILQKSKPNKKKAAKNPPDHEASVEKTKSGDIGDAPPKKTEVSETVPTPAKDTQHEEKKKSKKASESDKDAKSDKKAKEGKKTDKGQTLPALNTSVKKEKKDKKKSAKDDDDVLLNEILEKIDENDGLDAAHGGEDAEKAEASGQLYPPANNTNAILSMMTIADVKGLDYRTERIKNFGKDSVPDVSGDELRRNGVSLPKIRKGPFVTPNLNSGHWHTLGGTGSTVELKMEGTALSSPTAASSAPVDKEAGIPKGRAIYSIDVNSKGYLKAHTAFDFTINTAMGDINALFGCWQEHPYHLPMLLQLSQAFHITGDTANSNLYMDMALHVVGMILSGGGFSIARTPRDRALPYRYPCNKPVFVALCRGMHSALRQGSAHTAFEMCKVLLSLDEEDPEGAALMLDVTAIRSREWLFLIELHHRLVSCALGEASSLCSLPVATDAAAAEAPAASESPTVEAADSPDAFAPPPPKAAGAITNGVEWVALPSLHYNAALARHMFASNSNTGGKGQDKVKGNRTAGTAGQRALVSPPSSTAASATQTGKDLVGYTSDVRTLANAIGLFPQAALSLAEAIEERTSQDPWLGMTFLNEDAKAAVRASCGAMAPYVEATTLHLAKLFAASSKGMWKSTQHAKFLRDAATIAVNENLTERFYGSRQTSAPSTTSEGGLLDAPLDVAANALGAYIRRQLGTVLHDRYVALPEENVTGVFASQIPRELLEAAFEDQRGHNHQRFERVTEAEVRLMERYEAAFGALPNHLRFAERMEAYGARLEEHVRALGQDEGAVRMFLRTLLPWNDVQEMALRRAFEEAGVEDPAVAARRMQRQYERDVMDRADALAPDEDLPEDQW